MATTGPYYSTQLTNIRATPPVALAVSDHSGKLRIAYFDYTQAAGGTANDIIHLVRLPAGRVRIIGGLSQIYHNLTTASATIDIGWAAHTDLDGVAVAADVDGLDDGISTEAAGTIAVGTVAAVAALGGNKLLNSQEGIDITLKCIKLPAASDTVAGHIAYVMD